MPSFRLSASAEADIDALLAWTEDRFGATARRRYEVLLVTGLRDIAADPERAGSVDRPELGTAIKSYHLRYSRERARERAGFVRRPRHLLLYRVLAPDVVGIGRVLHDVMELVRHLPRDFGDR